MGRYGSDDVVDSFVLLLLVPEKDKILSNDAGLICVGDLKVVSDLPVLCLASG